MVAVKPGKQREHSTPVRLSLHSAASKEKAEFLYKSNGAVTSQLPRSMLLHPQNPVGHRAAAEGTNDKSETSSADVFLKNNHNPGVTVKVPVHDTTPKGQLETPSLDDE